MAGLELLRQGAALVQAGTLAGFTAGQKRAVVEALARVTSSVDAGYVKALGELDGDPQAVPSASKHVGATFLKHRLNASAGDAGRDVAAARALFSDEAALPLIGAAFAGGEVTRSHADVAVRCVNRIPIGDDRTLGQHRADAIVTLCTNYLLGGGDSSGGGGSSEQRSRVGAPLTRVIVVATPGQVAAARAAIPLPRDTHGDPIHPPGATPPGTTRPHPPPGLATEVSTCPLDPGAFGRLLCDAVEQAALVGANRQVLYLGRSTRLASASQRIALIARDRGCHPQHHHRRHGRRPSPLARPYSATSSSFITF